MALFQKPPRSLEEAEVWKPLDLGPEKVLEMEEPEWYARIYRGADAPQLTWRAVIMGSVLGFLLAFTNLYIGLKTGWALGVAITAAIISFSVWNFFLRLGIARSPMTILETNCMQSTASSAGYATGGTMVSAIAALLMIEGHHLPLWVLLLWTLFLGALGTLMAIPMKRNMINQERLKFPTGTAAAVTLQSLYSEGRTAMRKAKALFSAAAIGALFPLALELEIKVTATLDAAGNVVERARSALLPGTSNLFDWLPARGVDPNTGAAFKPSDWTMVMDHNPVMIAAGALVGLRIAIWMTLSSLFLAFVLGPAGLQEVWTSPSGEIVRATSAPGSAWREVGVWSGVAVMVSSGLLAFAMQWRTIGRAFARFFAKDQGHGEGAEREALVAATEVPMSWFTIGMLVSGAGVVWLAWYSFHIPVLFGTIAVLLSFFLALVACRATGESDITPVGALGKITQLTYGVLMRQNVTANLMTASITSSTAGSAADLLTDLKSGYLLGANPRRQFMAQFLGIFAGTAATVFGFRLLVPDAAVLEAGTPYPAPAAQAWKAVAEVFKLGFDNMHPMHLRLLQQGLIAGVVLHLLDVATAKVPAKWKTWVPSATGIGLGLILPFQYPFSMLLGAIGAAAWNRASKKSADDYLVPVAAGLIAGISIMGVLVAVVNAFLPPVGAGAG
ncbi:MAG: OPT family oligopeptide transporter [Planctomycetota bacterium]|nr:MAG: OPT family oligopeptide transporter [Planctomycetota bacterium]